jgi:hypothetical protein
MTTSVSTVKNPITSESPSILCEPKRGINEKVTLQRPKLSFATTENSIYQEIPVAIYPSLRECRQKQFWGHTHFYINNRFNIANTLVEDLLSILKNEISPYSKEKKTYLPETYEVDGLDSNSLDPKDVEKIKEMLDLESKGDKSAPEIQRLNTLRGEVNEIFERKLDNYRANIHHKIKYDAGIVDENEFVSFFNRARNVRIGKIKNQKSAQESRIGVVRESILQQKRKREEVSPKSIDSSLKNSKSRKTSSNLLENQQKEEVTVNPKSNQKEEWDHEDF